MEIATSLLLGFGLAAACGLRIFVPLLALAVASRLGLMSVPDGFAWVASTPALITLGFACVVEIAAYHVPWLDHLLDIAATPAAAAAGTLVAMTQLGGDATGLHPALGWMTAAVLGGGTATAVQATTVTTRAASTMTTGGAANPLVAWVENIGAAILSLLSILAPLLLGVLLLVTASGLAWWWFARKRRRPGVA